MITHKFSGHLNSNLFIRAADKISVTLLWSRHIVPLIESYFSNAGLQNIKSQGSWDECLSDLFELGAVYVDQKRIFNSSVVDERNLIRIHLMPKRYDSKLFQSHRDIVFEDVNVIIVNKPALLPVHPTIDNASENLLKLLQQRGNNSVTCLHRLDLETTGLVLFSKNETATKYFQKVFEQKKIKKIYKAVLDGSNLEPGYRQNWMIKSDRAPKVITNAALVGSSSIELNVLQSSAFRIPCSLISEIELLTGRTHQIRAQMSFLGFPLVGDSLYGGRDFPSDFICSHFLLHSTVMEFVDQAGRFRHFELQPTWLK